MYYNEQFINYNDSYRVVNHLPVFDIHVMKLIIHVLIVVLILHN